MGDDKRRQCRTQGRFSAGGGNFKKAPNKHDRSESDSLTHQSDNRQYVTKKVDHSQRVVSPRQQMQYVQPKMIRTSGFYTLIPRGSVTEAEAQSTVGRNTEVSRIYYKPDFIPSAKGYEIMDSLKKEIEFQEGHVVIGGEKFKQPRLVAWFGPFSYTYSGLKFEKRDLTVLLASIKHEIETVLKEECELLDVELNSVLLNLYRDHKDSVAWHSDDELAMGIRPTIASVSLGEVRKFEIREKKVRYQSEKDADYVVNLEHGSLLIMTGPMQQEWQHRVPKEFHDKNERINLTFRTVFPRERTRTAFQYQRIPDNNPPLQEQRSSAPQAPYKFVQDDFPALF